MAILKLRFDRKVEKICFLKLTQAGTNLVHSGSSTLNAAEVLPQGCQRSLQSSSCSVRYLPQCITLDRLIDATIACIRNSQDLEILRSRLFSALLLDVCFP